MKFIQCQVNIKKATPPTHWPWSMGDIQVNLPWAIVGTTHLTLVQSHNEFEANVELACHTKPNLGLF